MSRKKGKKPLTLLEVMVAKNVVERHIPDATKMEIMRATAKTCDCTIATVYYVLKHLENYNNKNNGTK